ncbi:MAG: hypothetical protein HZB25_11430 [Candidatus Eisenbacteria bacterium]|nr:hypothetical protein [Candidatus Eisenbacteria bacterium]
MGWVRCIFVIAFGVGLGCSAFASQASAADSRDILKTQIHRSGGRVALPSGAMDGSGLYPDALPHYHNQAQLVCTDCHIMHASQSHYYNLASPAVNEQVPYTNGANRNLLKAADPLDLCLSCHDGQTFAPDVVSADANGLTNRSAGYFDQPEVTNIKGHDLGRGLPMGPNDYCYRCHFSAGDQKKVTCIDCHTPHGNNIARNLQWISWPEGTPDLGVLTNPAANGMQRYETENVAYGSLNSVSLREPSNMCLDCHHVFSGGYYINDPHGSADFAKHPTYDSERSSTNNIAQGAVRGTTVPAHWEGGTGSGFGSTARVRPLNEGSSSYASARTINASTNGVFCLSCHKAHGSDQAFGLVFPASPSGYSAGGCDQCHLVANIP